MRSSVSTDGWGGRLEAHAEEREDGLPTYWTPEYVETRLIEAVAVIDQSTRRPGPKAYGNNWPDVLREFSDLVDSDAWENYLTTGKDSRIKPDAAAVSRADEALGWIPAYVGTEIQHDAIRLYVTSKAFGRPVEPVLAKRLKKARRGMTSALLKINAEREQERRRLAKAVAEEANGRKARLIQKRKGKPLTYEQNAFIDQEAHERMAAACAPFLPMHEKDIRPHHAMPGKCLSRRNYDKQRKLASAAIAEALNFAEVPIR